MRRESVLVKVSQVVPGAVLAEEDAEGNGGVRGQLSLAVHAVLVVPVLPAYFLKVLLDFRVLLVVGGGNKLDLGYCF